MGKYKYVAQVDCKRGNVINSKQIEFTADEKSFDKTSDIKDLNKIALRFAKNQNKEELSGFQKIEVRGYSKLHNIEQQNHSSSSRYSKNTKKGLINSFFGKLSKVSNTIERILR